MSVTPPNARRSMEYPECEVDRGGRIREYTVFALIICGTKINIFAGYRELCAGEKLHHRVRGAK